MLQGIRLKTARAAFDAQQWQAAVPLFRQVLGDDPHHFEALISCGHCEWALGNIDAAFDYAQTALDVAPEHAVALRILAAVFKSRGDDDALETIWHRILAQFPDDLEATVQLATLLVRGERWDQADALVEQALRNAPDSAPLLWCRLKTILRQIYPSVAAAETHYQLYLDTLRRLQTVWPNADAAARDMCLRQQLGASSYLLAVFPQNPRQAQAILGPMICDLMAEAAGPVIAPLRAAGHGARIKVGFVGGKLGTHTVGKLFGGWAVGLDREKFEVLVFNIGGERDAQMDQYAAQGLTVIDTPTQWRNAARCISEHGCAVLIYPEIGMDLVSPALAALRLAPVQAMSWGHPQTSGLPTMDYFLSGEFLEPDDGPSRYSETLVKLPGLSVQDRSKGATGHAIDRTIFDAGPDDVVYLCSQTLYKYPPDLDWMFPAIARRVPGAVFVFVDRDPHHTAVFRPRLDAVFAQAGVPVDRHVRFLAAMDQAAWTTMNRSCDIFLDSLWWSGGMTTLEAVACGLPVIAVPGADLKRRTSSAVVRQMGLDHHLAQDPADWLEKAVAWGTDATLRASVTAEFKAAAARLCDDACVRGLEDFLIQAVERAHAEGSLE